MRLLNKGKTVEVISLADGTKIHIYPGEEEEIPDEVYYKTTVRVSKAKDLVEVSGKKRHIHKLTREELYKLNKDAQIKLLNRYGVEEIPKYEKDRVNEILKLQG